MSTTYQQNDTAQACTLANYCAPGGVGVVNTGRQAETGATAGTSEASFTVTKDVLDQNRFSFECILETGTTGDSGTWTVRIDFSSGHMDVRWRSCFICRVSSGCVNQESIGNAQNLSKPTNDGTQFTDVTGSAVTLAAGDKVIIVLRFDNTNTMFDRTIGITPSLVIDSPFTVGGPIQQTIAATAIGVAVLSTGLSFVLAIAATAIGAVSLTRGLSFIKTISATAVATAVLSTAQTVFKTLAAAATGVALLSASRLILKAISAVASGVVSLSKAPTFTRAIAATATGVASLTRALTFMRAIAATAIGAVSLSTVTTFVKAIAATAVGAAALVANLIGGAGAAAAKLRRRVGRLIVNPGTLLRR